MRLGIDARLLYNNTGIGRYTRSLCWEYAVSQHLASQDSIYLFTEASSESEAKNRLFLSNSNVPENVSVVSHPCTRRIIWTNWYLPSLLTQHKIDVYHGVCNFELPLKKVCRYVVTIHDLVPLFFPRLVPRKHLLFFELFMKRAAHAADVIITDSNHSKQDIVQYLDVPEEKVKVIYLGYSPLSHYEYDEHTFRTIMETYHIRQPYMLFVGVIEPKKNLERLVEAFVLLQQEYDVVKEFQLVIAGGKGWFSEHLYNKVHDLKLENQILLTGFIPDNELPYLYSGAKLFVFPSIYEGFGLPVLEAMSFGIPVVTSNMSSLPEIAGDAAILVDPYSPESIAQGIFSVLSDTTRQETMKQAGQKQAQQFSWKRTAEQTYQVYQEVYQI